MRLTTEQFEQLRGEEPPRIVANDEEFVLVRSEVYERIKGLIAEPEEIDESLYVDDASEEAADSQAGFGDADTGDGAAVASAGSSNRAKCRRRPAQPGQ